MRSGIDFWRFFRSLLLFENGAVADFLALAAFWWFMCWVLCQARRLSAASVATWRVFTAPSGCLSFGSLLMDRGAKVPQVMAKWAVRPAAVSALVLALALPTLVAARSHGTCHRCLAHGAVFASIESIEAAPDHVCRHRPKKRAAAEHFTGCRASVRIDGNHE